MKFRVHFIPGSERFYLQVEFRSSKSSMGLKEWLCCRTMEGGWVAADYNDFEESIYTTLAEMISKEELVSSPTWSKTLEKNLYAFFKDKKERWLKERTERESATKILNDRFVAISKIKIKL